jgi:FtsH-binding integral membrane protein
MEYNQNLYTAPPVSATRPEEVSRTFMLSVYNWMTMGLAITGIIAYFVSEMIDIYFVADNIFIFYGLLIFELIFVWALSAMIHKIPPFVGVLAFLFYAFLNGLTMSIIFLLYTSASVAYTFIICAGMFGAVSVFGYITKMDLTKIGGFLMMALIGLIIASVVNIFVANSTLYWIISYAGVIIFVGLTAYDTQKIKNYAKGIDANSDDSKRASVIGALELYLDFINLFLFLLRILGRRN